MTDRDPRDGETRTDHEFYGEWDGAYVLGALSPADRHAYEEHLATCPICSAGVLELAGLPGLLGGLPSEETMPLLLDEERPEPPDLLPGLLHRMRRRRRVRRWSIAAAVAATAVVAATITLVLPTALPSSPAAAEVTSLQQVGHGPSPLSATVSLTGEQWGTSVGMTCRWNADSGWSPASGGTTRWAYGLWIVSRNGTSDRVATWTAEPGETVRTTDSTAVPVHDIVRIELRALDGGTVLLAAPVHPAG